MVVALPGGGAFSGFSGLRAHAGEANSRSSRSGASRRMELWWSSMRCLPLALGLFLARRITDLLKLAGVPMTLGECGVSGGILPLLAEEANQQWTARFNPRPVNEADLLSLYEAAL